MNEGSPSPKKTKKRNPKINIKLETAKRIIIFSIATIILGSAQCSFFPMLDICKGTPDLIMGLIIAVALCDNGKSAMILSVGAGFFIDAIGGAPLAFSPIIYFIFATVINIVSAKMLKSLPAFLLLLLPSLLYRALCTTLLALLNGVMAVNGGFLLGTLLAEAVSTLILCIPIYFIINLATKPLRERKKFSFK